MAALPPPTADGPLLPWLLAALAPMSRTGVKDLLRAGRVSVNGTPTTRHDHPVRAGDRVVIASARDVVDSSAPGLPILYEDDAVIAVDKPSGLLTVATVAEKLDTAFVTLSGSLHARRAGRPFVVHRLDRGTSGVLLFARSEPARDALKDRWEAVEKTYLAVTVGVPKPAVGRVENFLLEGRDLRVKVVPEGRPGAKRAATGYRLLGSRNGFGLVEVALETGRKHQIRVHLAGLGCPVAGDREYRATADPAGRLGLHAWRVAFPHPVTGRRVEVEAPFPAALRRVVPLPPANEPEDRGPGPNRGVS